MDKLDVGMRLYDAMISPRFSATSAGMLRALTLLAVACSLTLACDDKTEKAEPTASLSLSAAPTASAAAAAEAPKFDPKQLELQVTAVFERWLKSQNSGDFAGYSELYAAKFHGIKRVGSKTYQFDHDGWLNDRKQLFQRPVTVTAKDLQLSVSPHTAVVHFEQTWQTPTFKDVGPKQLVLSADKPNEFRITREEMLSSKTGQSKPSELTKTNFLLKRFSGRHFVVLTSEDGHDFERMVSEHPQFLSFDAAIRPVVDDLLPKKLKPLRSAHFRLYGAHGEACQSDVKAAWVLSHAIPHSGMVLTWEGRDSIGGTSGAAWSKPQIATDIWRMTKGRGRYLALELKAGCDDGLVAIASLEQAQPAPSVWSVQQPDETQRAMALEAFQSSADYVAIQKQFREETKKNAPWHTDTSLPPQIVVFEHPKAGRYLVVGASAGAGCGSFYGELLTFWKLQDKPILIKSEVGPLHQMMPKAAVDLDGDGLPEFLSEEGLMSQQGGGVTQLLDISPPVFECPC